MTEPRLFRFMLLWVVPVVFAIGITTMEQPIRAAGSDIDPSYLQALEWRLIGPHRGGRSIAVAGHPKERRVFYFGSTGGGVWKTEDAGHGWTNVSDGYFETGSVGAIAIASATPETLYVGMGETCIRGNTSHGDGVYKSTDGGKTWKNVGLKDTRHIGRIVIDPTDPNLVYVAALGHVWGAHPDRGIYRTTDGGGIWEKILFVNEDVGAIDLVMDPLDSTVLYAATWEARRYPWGLRAAGPGSGIHKSTDGGTSWTELTTNPGLPESHHRGRIGIAVSPAQPERVWVIMEAENDQSGVYRSDDRGATWKLMSQRAELVMRPWYYHHIHADPKDPEIVYVLNTRLWKSVDGGATYEQIPAPHGDIHDLWIDPEDPSRMIEANDGGGTVSFDGGESWSSIYNQPTAQFYHVETDNQFPYRVYGCQQDNSTLSLPSRSDLGAITQQEWYAIGGGEDGYIAVRPDDPNIVFAGDHYYLTRYDHRTKQVQNISPWPEMYWGWGARDLKYRFQWVYPVMLSPHDPNILYATSQYVHKSTNEGRSWEVVSPDLTRADPKTLEPTPSWGEDTDTGPYWGPIKRDNTGIEWYAVIFAFAESPVEPGVLWAGSDDGVLHVSRDAGKNWENVTPPDLPEFTLMSIIDPSPHDAATAYVAGTRYKLDDPRPYLLKTNDYGKSWTTIVEGIGDNDFTRAIREDPERRGLLYAGTETGMFVSFNDGENWQPLQLNLPVVPIRDIDVKGNELVVATHGRSFWILDDLTVLRQLEGGALTADVHLFEPAETVRFRAGVSRPVARAGGHEVRNKMVAGQNPPNGAVVYYYLKTRPTGPVSLAFKDAAGTVLRSYEAESVPAEAGLNRFVWENMRYPDPVEIPDAIFRRYDPRGPLTPPGTYTVELDAGGQKLTETFDVVKDPRLDTTDEDFQKLHRFLIDIREKITETHEVVLKIQDLRDQIEEAAADKPEESDAGRMAKALTTRLYQIEEQLFQFQAKATQDLIDYPTRLNDKLSTVAALVEYADAPPNEQDYEIFRDISSRIDERVAKLNELLEKDWPKFVEATR